MPGPMPEPVPVPAPPPDPLPCDTVGGPGGASMAPGSESTADASDFAGMFSCSMTGGSVFVWTGSSFGAFSTGTVILSLPGSSALRGGSFILLPPPPPPPPGPGSLNQMMSLLGFSGSSAKTGTTAGLYRLARMSSTNITTWMTAEPPTANPIRLGWRSSRNGTSSGCAPSTYTDRCPAVVVRAAALGVLSAIGSERRLV